MVSTNRPKRETICRHSLPQHPEQAIQRQNTGQHQHGSFYGTAPHKGTDNGAGQDGREDINRFHASIIWRSAVSQEAAENADNKEMNVSSVGTKASSSSSGTSDALAALQKKVRDLTAELKAVATSTMEAKAKKLKTELLQSMIQVLQAQIAAIQQQRAQAQADAANKKAMEDAATAKTSKGKSKSNAGQAVDTYV